MAELLNEKDQLIALETLFKEEKLDEGLELSVQLLKEFPDSFQIRFMSSKVLRATGKLKEAEEILSDLISTHDNHLNLFLEMGGLSQDLKKYDQALDYFNKALFIDPFNSQAKEAVKHIGGNAGSNGSKAAAPQAAPPPEKKDWQKDTLPEEGIGAILDESQAEQEADEDVLTEDSIQLDEEDLSPSIPGVDLPYVDESEVKVETAPSGIAEDVKESLMADPDFIGTKPETSKEDVSTEDMADLFADETGGQKSDTVTTRVPEPDRSDEFATAEKTGSGVDSANVPPPEGDEFVTESAAELYLSQGLYEEALFIYEKLDQTKPDDRFKAKVRELKSKSICQKKIKALTVFLNIIQERGGEIV
jgi:tetratricopeptide (TPR) repeat protein